VVAGEAHTCAVALNDRALCWGLNVDGQLGDGTTTRRLTPVAVAGGLEIDQLSAFSRRNAVVTLNGQLYQWGTGGLLTPVMVPGP
jgi:alpha-tubulin suppressor-like RCC1 family protein